jgi:hypothetical protein
MPKYTVLALILSSLTLPVVAAAAPKASAARPGAAQPAARPSASPQVRPRPASSNKLFTSMAAVNRAWGPLRPIQGRVIGTITVDPAVQGAILGSCSDIVVNVASATTFESVATVKAFGDISQGSCAYGVFVKPSTHELYVGGYYGGPASGHPGDYLSVRPNGGGKFKAVAGETVTRDLLLTYDYIK